MSVFPQVLLDTGKDVNCPSLLFSALFLNPVALWVLWIRLSQHLYPLSYIEFPISPVLCPVINEAVSCSQHNYKVEAALSAWTLCIWCEVTLDKSKFYLFVFETGGLM